MKTVFVLAGLIALVMGGAVPIHQSIKSKSVEPHFIEYQKKVLALFEHSEQLDLHAEYYKIGKEYNIEANIDKYTKKEAVEEFLTLYRTGFLPKYHKFSVFYERMRDEAIALFRVMYYAKDFDTFYKTAAWAKIHLNEEQFLYAYFIALTQRTDTEGIVLPAPYEVYPQFFLNKEALNRMYRTKMQDGLLDPKAATQYGIVKENDYYVYYANYSNSLTYPNEEQKLAYFTEDVGLNAYYFYFHSTMPFWWKSEKLSIYKERLGEIFFSYYQQLLARYYLERLSNGLGDIPEFSWFQEFKTGYYPQLTGNYLPFAQRSNNFKIHNENNYENIRYLDAYEKAFFQFLQKGDFKSADKEVNYIGNYWHMNSDLYSETSNKELHKFSYEIIARHVLGAGPKSVDKYSFMPTALDFYQTSLRDPAFYQLYQRILGYLIDYKEYVKPYSYNELHYVGVKINDVKVTELTTYFDYFDFNATSSVFFSQEELKTYPTGFVVRQPRLNHKPFSVTVDLKSDVASDAVIKIFIGPKYDSNGYPVDIEQDWMKFYELDWFVQKLVPGENKIVRESNEFVFYKDDSVPITEIYKWLDQGKVPYDMSVVPDNMPRRLMLPKGTVGGYPFQLFVFVYPYKGETKVDDVLKNFIADNKPFGYPLDRPVREAYFRQPNMYFEDVHIYHKDAYFPYQLNVPTYFTQKKQYTFMPTALDVYQTSLRDPAFYQLYWRILGYLIHNKEYTNIEISKRRAEPYSYNNRQYVGVEINDVTVSELTTYFAYFDFNATNSVFSSEVELIIYPTGFVVRQPRLNNKPFSVTVDIKSDLVTDAVFKIFIGPKYDNNGYPADIEQDWMKFYEMDWFVQELVPGQNKIERKSTEFTLFKDDSVPITEVYKLLDQGKVPYDMSVVPDNMPRRLMLPKGTVGGYPFQLFVFVYPYNGVLKGDDAIKSFIVDNKPFGYPLDRPVSAAFFRQPNAYFKDVRIYHEGAYIPYEMNVPNYFIKNKL